jgi:hypothetical protein
VAAQLAASDRFSCSTGSIGPIPGSEEEDFCSDRGRRSAVAAPVTEQQQQQQQQQSTMFVALLLLWELKSCGEFDAASPTVFTV